MKVVVAVLALLLATLGHASLLPGISGASSNGTNTSDALLPQRGASGARRGAALRAGARGEREEEEERARARACAHAPDRPPRAQGKAASAAARNRYVQELEAKASSLPPRKDGGKPVIIIYGHSMAGAALGILTGNGKQVDGETFLGFDGKYIMPNATPVKHA